MKKILFLILFTTTFLSGQIKLNQIEPCYVGGVRQDSCFVMTDANGKQQYIDLALLRQIISNDSLTELEVCAAIAGFGLGAIMGGDQLVARTQFGTCKLLDINNFSSYNCDSVEVCLESPFFCEMVKECIYDNGFCDSVLTCIYNAPLEDIICTVLGELSEGGAIQYGDSIIVRRDGSCWKAVYTGGEGGGMGITGVLGSDCIDVEIISDTTVQIILKIDPDPTNATECREDGIYTPDICSQISSTAIDVLSIGLYLYTFNDGGDVCKRVPFGLNSGDCITLDLDGDGFIRAEVVISLEDGNIAECRPSGLYVPSACKQFEDLDFAGTLAPGNTVLTFNGTTCEKKVVPAAASQCPTLTADPNFPTFVIVIDADGVCSKMTWAVFKANLGL